MKKFYTAIPLQVGGLVPYLYEPRGNEILRTNRKTAFPILAAAEGYCKKGEEFQLIAVGTDVPVIRENLEYLRHELEQLNQDRGLQGKLIPVLVPDDSSVATQAATFQKLIEYAEEDDELFACMTYGTKPLSTALMMAVQYAYRVKKNTIISCVVYGEVQRESTDQTQWTGILHDMTALIRLDELVWRLAERKVQNPKAAIDAILSL